MNKGVGTNLILRFLLESIVFIIVQKVVRIRTRQEFHDLNLPFYTIVYQLVKHTSRILALS